MTPSRWNWLLALSLLLLVSAPLARADGIALGSDLVTFAVLGATTVTNVPSSIVGGNVGVSPGSAITGSAGIVFTAGSVQANTALAAAAQSELTTALQVTGPGSLPPTSQLSSSELAGLTLAPGVYSFSQFAGGFASLTGTSADPGVLTLDGEGNADATWVFQMASTLTTSAATEGAIPSSRVNVINAGSGAGLYWNVGSSATLGTYSIFAGNILASTSISLDTGATDACGRALASTGQVSLQMNSLDNLCPGTLAASNGLSGGLGAPPVSPVPEPATWGLLCTGVLTLLGLACLRPSAILRA